VREALQSSGFVDEVSQSLTLALLSGDGAEARERGKKRLERESAQWQRILGGVSWWSLLSREGAIALRLDGEQREFLLLFRTAAGETERILAALRQILYGICTRHPTYEMDSSSHEGESVTVLYELLDPGETLCLAGKGDVILLSSSRLLLKRSLQLLSREGSDVGYDHGRERAADLKNLPSRIAPDGRDVLEVHVRPSKLLPEVPALAGFQSFVLGADVAGDAIRYSFHFHFAPGGSPGGSEDAELFRAAFLERPGATFFQRLVPRDALSFAATSGSEPRALGEFLGRLVRQLLPEGEGEGLLGKLGGWETSRDIDIQEDFFSLLSGRRIQVSGQDGTLFLFELKEAREGRKRFTALLPKLEGALRALGLEPKPEPMPEVDGEVRSFSLTLPSGMPQLGSRWLFGTADEFFALGTSPDLLREVLEVKAGKRPGIGENPDFVKETRLPAGDLQQVRYASGVCEVLLLRAGLALLPLLSGVLPDGDDSAVTKVFLKASARLVPAARRLAFLDREYSHMLREGDALLGAGRILLKDVTD
jgi:hypothetical protein